MKKEKLAMLLISLLSLAAVEECRAQEHVKTTSKYTDTVLVADSLLVDSASTSKRGERRRRQRYNSLLGEEQTDKIFSSLFGTSKKLSNADSIIKHMDALPPFGIYKDNFFIVGTQMFTTPTRWNSDAKFQVSIRHRLTNSTLPFKTYLFLTYTQKAFWDVFKESFPFRDLNYNPSLGIGKTLVYKNRLLGAIALQLEHESNGKDGIDSRSWNKVTMTSTFIIHEHWMLESEMWIPIVDGNENKNIVDYSGWANFSVDYTSPNKKYVFGVSVTKRKGWNLNHNVTLQAAARIFSDSNQFLFLEYYNGYGESMLDYKQYRQRLRLGFVIKPDFMNLF